MHIVNESICIGNKLIRTGTGRQAWMQVAFAKEIMGKSSYFRKRSFWHCYKNLTC